MTTDAPQSSTRQVPLDIADAARSFGWDEGLVARAKRLGVQDRDLRFWIVERGRTQDQVRETLDRRERLLSGSIRVREANWSDNEALADMFADAPESISGCDVTVERGPNAFAQFALCENGSLTLAEEDGVALAAVFHSVRNTIVGGERLSADFAAGMRVRRGHRGRDLSRLLQDFPRPWNTPIAGARYHYLRAQNFDSERWIERAKGDIIRGQDHRSGEVSGLPVTISHFRPARVEFDATGLRRAKRGDAHACAALIGRTHAGLDLFRPCSGEFLADRLDARAWSRRPAWAPPVYGWDDFWVVERGGRITACGGLWDRGADLREVWRLPGSEAAQTIAAMAVIDFGYAPGREDDMARLLTAFAVTAAERGRTSLMAPLEFLPALRQRLATLEERKETRYLQWVGRSPAPRRPFADLVYW